MLIIPKGRRPVFIIVSAGADGIERNIWQFTFSPCPCKVGLLCSVRAALMAGQELEPLL